jgi:hypothetical protein
MRWILVRQHSDITEQLEKASLIWAAELGNNIRGRVVKMWIFGIVRRIHRQPRDGGWEGDFYQRLKTNSDPNLQVGALRELIDFESIPAGRCASRIVARKGLLWAMASRRNRYRHRSHLVLFGQQFMLRGH